MSDYPMLISNKLHSFRNFGLQTYEMFVKNLRGYRKIFDCFVFVSISWLY